jgi:hypothetical protein
VAAESADLFYRLEQREPTERSTAVAWLTAEGNPARVSQTQAEKSHVLASDPDYARFLEDRWKAAANKAHADTLLAIARRGT